MELIGHQPSLSGEDQVQWKTQEEGSQDGSAGNGFTAKPDDLSLIPKAHIVEGES